MKIKAVSFWICLTVSLLSIGVQAEQTRRWEARSGLNSVFNGHLVRLTIFEAGAATVSSHAVIELRNAANRVVARKEAPLTRTSPVELDWRVPENAGLIKLRAIVTVTTEDLGFTAPLVTFEDINPSQGAVFKVAPPCGPGTIPGDPQADGSSPPPCPGWLVLTSTPE